MLKRVLKEYIKQNYTDIITVVWLLIIGVLIGIGIWMFIDADIKEVFTTSVKEVLDISKSETYIKTNIILNGISKEIIMIIILTILALTLFGKWLIYFLTVLKGVAITIYSAIIFNTFGFGWGILVELLLVVLVNMIYIPAFIYLVITFLELNFNLFKAKINNLSGLKIASIFVKVCMCFLVIFSSIVLEQIASNIVLKIYTKM